MSRIFNLNSPLMLFLARITDLMILSALWLLCCLPIITIGPATSAMCYVALKMARDEESGIARSFFHAFKTNFKQGLVLTLVFLVLGFILYVDFAYTANLSGVAQMLMRIVFFFFGICYLMIFSYIFPLQAQFENTLKNMFINSFLLSIRNLPRTVLVMIFNAAPILIFFFLPEFILQFLPLWLFLAPATISWMCAKQFKQIFDPLISPPEENEEEDAADDDE